MPTRDDTAPGFDPAAQEFPWWRRAMAQGLGYFGPSVVFVAIPVAFALGQPPGVVAAVAAAALLTGAVFIGTTLVMHWPERRRWLWIGGLVASIALLGLLSAGTARPTYFGSYVAATAAVLLPWRRARVLILAVTLVVLVVALVQRDLFGVVMAAMAFALGLSIGLGLETERTRQALRAAEERTAVLAVAAERERIGRDLHDILGHSLTTIAIKADLAGRLVGRDDTAARAEVDGLAAIARQALSDVRATASGMREVRLATEIASARSVLTAAGVEVATPSAIPPLDNTQSEVLGYVVREAVTNVVRHAGATTCTITCDGDEGAAGAPGNGSTGALAGAPRNRYGAWVRISDDGRGIDGPAPGRRGGSAGRGKDGGAAGTGDHADQDAHGTGDRAGSGLAGLRHRVAEAGGELTVESSASGTIVTARLMPPA